jgi:hypothetical protein
VSIRGKNVDIYAKLDTFKVFVDFLGGLIKSDANK